MVRNGKNSGRALLQAHRWHSNRFRICRLSRCLHIPVQTTAAREMDKNLYRSQCRLQSWLSTQPSTRWSCAHQILEYIGSTYRSFLRRQCNNCRQVAKVATHDRSSGTGEQVGQEYGEIFQLSCNQTQSERLHENLGKCYTIWAASNPGKYWRGTRRCSRTVATETDVQIRWFLVHQTRRFCCGIQR